METTPAVQGDFEERATRHNSKMAELHRSPNRPDGAYIYGADGKDFH
jgi:hypothetical protein